MNQSRTMNRIKAIASAVILAFTLEQLAFAAPASPSTVMSMQPMRINLPKDVAHIDEVYNGSSGNPRLILIQDAHTNVSGQLNIAEIISELVSEHKVRYVFTEAGMGDNSLSALRSSASKKIRKQIGLEYLRKGRLKGTEYLSLATDLDFKIWGVEDPDLYKDAFDSYKFIVEKRGTTLPQLNTLLADSQFLKEKIFNYELRDFDSIRLKYLGEKIKVSDYISTLESYLNSEEIDIFPAFKKLLEIQRLEKNIRFEKTESERNRFISAFQDFWNGSNVEPDGEEVIGSALESIRKKGGELTYQHFKRKLELLIASGKISADSFRHEYPDLNAYMVYADRAFELDMRVVVDERWIDAEMRPGKRGGGFCCSVTPDHHPFILVNYSGSLRDVLTVAHEVGHGIHQFLSAKTGILECDAPLTMAETASVFGEMLTFDRLLKRVKKPEDRLALRCGQIDDQIATIFRQIAMTRFELKSHESGMTDGELAEDDFNRFWMDVNRELYGKSILLSDAYRHGWKYIPHFIHTPFYCYAYSFAQLFVLALFSKYKNKTPGFTEQYKKILSLGGSEKPEVIAQMAGVDLTDQSFWVSGLELFKKMVGETADLAREIKRV